MTLSGLAAASAAAMASPLELDDAIINCKACNLLLEGGKAYELAGYRWHIECFQCCKCQQSLNAQANLLLLGDGSLICNDCTYTCEVCKNKIEDLAILTSDLAFCESCFRCRNCDKQMENLKYARTSHGIYCMECHEVQTASRRRRKARQMAAQQHARQPGKTSDANYRTLPALPPEPPAPAPAPGRNGQSERLGREAEELSQAMQTLTLPATTYNSTAPTPSRRRSTFGSSGLNMSDDGMLIPVTLDPTPVAATFPPEALQLTSPFTNALSGSRFSSGSESLSPELPPRRSREEGPMAPYALVQPPTLVPIGHHSHGSAGIHASGASPSMAPLMDGKEPRVVKKSPPTSSAPSPRSAEQHSANNTPPAPAITASLTASPDMIRHNKSSPASSDSTPARPKRDVIPARGDSLAASQSNAGSEKRKDGSTHPARSSSRTNTQPAPFKDDDPDGYYAFSSLRSEWYPGSSEMDSPMPSASAAAGPLHTPDPAGQEMAVRLDSALKRIADLEAENLRLNGLVEKSANIKNADSVLEEKRLTMATLDSHREILMRELKTMNDEWERQKRSGKAGNLDGVKHDIMTDFSSEMDHLKAKFRAEIEVMVKRRTELEKEISNLIQMKDKGFQEYEALSSRNAQLTNANNQLQGSLQTQQYRGGRSPDGRNNPGLGIDAGLTGPANWAGFNTDQFGPPMGVADHFDGEVSIVESPQLVEIRKAKPKTKVWGRQIARGLKGALGIEKQSNSGGVTEAGLPYSQLSSGESPNMGGGVGLGPRAGERTGGFGSLFMSGNKAGRKVVLGGVNSKAGSSATNLVSVSAPNELSTHYEQAGHAIPGLVTACIDEVEARGIDQQGIYRLSGSKNEVDELKDGFESRGTAAMSGIDIHVVSSALKQYFRKLDTPLITYDAYDALLEAAQVADGIGRAVEMRAVLDRMPEAHFVCLKYLLAHLNRVVSRSKENLMNVNNLSIVFAPTIMRTEDIAREHSDLEVRGQTMQSLIELADTIFSLPGAGPVGPGPAGPAGPAQQVPGSSSGMTSTVVGSEYALSLGPSGAASIAGSSSSRMYSRDDGARSIGSREVPAV